MIATGPGWELRCGDCLDPETGLTSVDAVDHVITDPPYSADLYKRTRTNKGIPGLGKACDTESNIALASGRIGAIDDMIEPCAIQWARIARRWVLVFHCDDILISWRRALLGAGLGRRRNGVWLKPRPMPQVSGDRPAQDVEHWTLVHRRGQSRWNGGGRGASIVCGVCTGRERPDHPSPKPLAVMEHFVSLLTDPGDLVCDPFAGSGTTGVACIRLGRRFLGWERDPNFFETARKRLENTREQRQLFDARPEGKQAKLW